MMSDTADAVENHPEHPEPAPPDGSMFKVVFLKLDDHGVPGLWGCKWHALPAKIYDRGTALKYATFEAQKLPKVSLVEMLLAVVTPGGRCIAVLAGGTGKPVRPLVALRTKRALVTLMPNDVKVRRRTSRPLGRSVAKAGKRRTSRGRA